jgi:hypothetical protein
MEQIRENVESRQHIYFTYVIRERRRQTEEIEPELTFGKRGHELNLIKLLQKVIETRPPPSNEHPCPSSLLLMGRVL